jgi:predicted GNAT family acetyltransferase
VRGTEDAAAFLRAVEPLLVEDPVRNNVLLSLVHQRVAHPEPGRYWSIEQRGSIAGAVFQSPPTFPALVTAMPPALIPEAVEHVLDDGVQLPGVTADAATAARFAGAWTEQTRSGAAPTLAQRIYEVQHVVAPAATPGRRRLAGAGDRDVLVAWFAGFAAEIGDPPGDEGAAVDRRVAAEQVWVWEDGTPVAFAALTAPIEGVVRVGPVYTAPDARGRGYASALVAQLSASVLERSLRCILYADLDNPTSNGIYRAIGYRAVDEVVRYRFGARRAR